MIEIEEFNPIKTAGDQYKILHRKLMELGYEPTLGSLALNDLWSPPRKHKTYILIQGGRAHVDFEKLEVLYVI